MKVVIRADASLMIGTGHVMRCLTLADTLREHGAMVSFVCRAHAGNLIDTITDKGYRVARLALGQAAEDAAPAHASWLGAGWREDAEATLSAIAGEYPDWLIVDHYALDARWEAHLRSHARRIMVVDDLADRAHDCDLLLDQNFRIDRDHQYDHLVPTRCRRLLGPKYALLRPEFRRLAAVLKRGFDGPGRVLISFGGIDQSNETEKSLRALQMLDRPDLRVRVVLGAAYPHRESLARSYGGREHIELHYQTPRMAEFMAWADLCVGAGGSTHWERCTLGLPTVVITTGMNQEALARDLQRAGAIDYLGRAEEVSADQIAVSVGALLRDSARLMRMSKAARGVIASEAPTVEFDWAGLLEQEGRLGAHI